MMKLFVVALVGLMGAYVLTMSVRDYSEHYEEMLTKRGKAQHFHSTVCSDPHVKDKTGQAEPCEDAVRVLRKDPSIHALYKVIEGWNLCHGGQCLTFVERSADTILSIVWIGVAVFAVLVLVLGYRFKLDYGKDQMRDVLASTVPSFVHHTNTQGHCRSDKKLL